MSSTNCLPSTCCCGCSLKTGGKIIAGLEMGLAIILFVLTVTLLIIGGTAPFGDTPEQVAVELIVTAVSVAVTFIMCGLVLRGIATNNSNLLIPWLALTIILMIGGFIFAITIAIIDLRNQQLSNSLGIILIIGTIIATLIQIYFWIVILALYNQMRGTTTRPGVTPIPA